MIYDDLVKRVEPSVNSNVEFRSSIPNKVPYLYGDIIKIKQVLYSILMNAVKKTEKGFIEFNVNTIEKYDVCRVIFTISDSGIGIGIDKINEILSVTGELNKDDIVNLEKSEFNIELCQKIIKSLGGNLLIKSKLDKGTDINISYLLYGMDAVDRIKSGKKYDYIIIEDDMRVISGYETLKRLKTIDNFNIPCIVILNSSKNKIKEHYLKDGFSDYILTDDLRNEIKRIIEKY